MPAAALPIKVLAIVILRLANGRLVLQRRTDDAPIAPGLLGFFGGHIEEGETPEQCIMRELAEETSLDVGSLDLRSPKEFILPASANYNRDRHFYIYEATVPNDDFEVYEGKRAETYDPAELLDRNDISEVVIRVMEQDVR